MRSLNATHLFAAVKSIFVGFPTDASIRVASDFDVAEVQIADIACCALYFAEQFYTVPPNYFLCNKRKLILVHCQSVSKCIKKSLLRLWKT